MIYVHISEKLYILLNNFCSGQHIVSLELAKRLKERNINVIPGWKLCRNCFKIARTDDDSVMWTNKKKKWKQTILMKINIMKKINLKK